MWDRPATRRSRRAHQNAWASEPYSVVEASHSTRGTTRLACVTSHGTSLRETRISRRGAGNDTMSPFRFSNSARGWSGSKPRGTRCSMSCEPTVKPARVELPQQRRELSTPPLIDDRLTKARQLGAVHHVLTGSDEELLRTDVHVQRRRSRRPLSTAFDGEVAADVRLVRRLVLGEAHVAVDAEHLGRGKILVPEARLDLLAKLGEERLHRLEPALLVLPAVRGEPVAPLVARERPEEPPVAIGEAFESLEGRALFRHRTLLKRSTICAVAEDVRGPHHLPPFERPGSVTSALAAV